MSDPVVQRRGLNWGRMALIVGAVVVLAAAAFGVRALSAPVERAGEPTIAVPSPSGTRFTSPSPSPTTSGTPSATSTPAASASSTPKSTIKSSGDFNWATATAPASGSQGTLYRYSVAVERSAKLKADSVAETVAGVLNDPRGWTGSGDVRFALVQKSKAAVNVYVASTRTAESLCGSGADASYTCVKGDTVVISADQWKSAAPSYAGNTGAYRTFLINHATGQLIGKSEAKCGGSGKKAPVMQQQGAGLGGCKANPWP